MIVLELINQKGVLGLLLVLIVGASPLFVNPFFIKDKILEKLLLLIRLISCPEIPDSLVLALQNLPDLIWLGLSFPSLQKLSSEILLGGLEELPLKTLLFPLFGLLWRLLLVYFRIEVLECLFNNSKLIISSLIEGSGSLSTEQFVSCLNSRSFLFYLLVGLQELLDVFLFSHNPFFIYRVRAALAILQLDSVSNLPGLFSLFFLVKFLLKFLINPEDSIRTFILNKFSFLHL